jgi:N-acetylmuramoyl-L-alanine amidase
LIGGTLWDVDLPQGWRMRDRSCERRRVLRGLAFCAVVGWRLDSAAAQPAGRRTPQPRRVPTVVIDPGHGGVDPGAISPNGVYEKGIVLATAWEFARELAARANYRVVLTRTTDEFLPLRERVARARAWKADLLLSIHADALPDTEMRGLSVFTQSAQASDREAAALAVSENRADLVGGVSLSHQPRDVGNILLDLTRRQTSNLSVLLANKIVVELGREVALRDRPQRFADFAVLTAQDVPSALVELGCLSNPAEERLLQRRTYQQKLARGLVRAVESFFAAHAAV